MTLTSLALGAFCLVGLGNGFAASPLRSGGIIGGTVASSTGIPQLGAVVQLYNRQDRPLQRVLTDCTGKFEFDSLAPDRYSVRVTMAAFFPAIQKDILVQPGTESLLAVHLSSFFSTIQLSYPPLQNGSLVTDDWKWVLRTATASRPIMRFTDDNGTETVQRPAFFSETRGLLVVSAGEGGTTTGVSNEADMGTAFALATSILGSNNVEVSGNFGYGSQTGVPATAFRTTYSRKGSPQISLTMRELFLPGHLGAATSGAEPAFPMLRTYSASFDDHMQLSDRITLKYGVSMDDVIFLNRLSYMSPYARLSYDLGNGSTLDLTFTSGNARPDLAGMSSDEGELQGDLTALGFFPLISAVNSRTQVQRGEDYEATYSRKVGSRTYSATVDHEAVTNAALSVMGPLSGVAGIDIMPDLFSNASVLNAGNFQSWGYTGAITQQLGEHIALTMMLGGEGALTMDNGALVVGSPEELRSLLHEAQRHVATSRVDATVPWTKTHVVASYQWSDNQRWATPGDIYSTAPNHAMPGLNLSVHQPLPGFARRVEATADIRNMLAQGYFPVGMANGQQLMLIETPRIVRGGLAFTF
ncbi:MAG TPA: carboxypeptidase-like regulatory domain-containing protein [Bryobacteraceae bacterium]|nr:carboxypeptidase-like regulatory domain-containing protein [Bryobacteraceae bacterium]